jgi:1-acyl-sn-glycerol-3-phosphate acyltransferase
MRLRVPVRPAFPVGPPTWPRSVPRPPAVERTGVHYDTSWARRTPARVARELIVDDVLKPLVAVLGSPRVSGLDRLVDLEPPVIFAANHLSHLDTPLLLTSLPARFRRRAVVAAAADYFFTSRLRGAVSALAIGAIPIDRVKVNRRSSDLAGKLLGEGWSLVIFPEGGRSPDGWAQAFRGGAAYLSVRTGRPVVPVFVEGTGRVLRKGKKLPTPAGRPFNPGSGVHVAFGPPLWPGPDDDARRFALRVEAAVATLGDEAATDWWSARQRSATGTTPSMSGPATAPWRRAWALDGPKRKSATKPSWP